MRQIIIQFILAYIRFFARCSLMIHKPIVIGITGSVGKSSARNAIFALLKDHYPTKVIEKGNSETGIPLGILGLSPINYSVQDWLRLMILTPFGLRYLIRTKYLIVEMGIDDPNPPKNMDYLLGIVQPDIAIFLNVFPVHSLQFDSVVPSHIKGKERRQEVIKAIAREKGRIITKSQARTVIFNSDDEMVNEIAQSVKDTKQLLSFGKDQNNNITYNSYEITNTESIFKYILQGKKNSDEIMIRIKNYLLPIQYREIFASTILLGKFLGLQNKQIINALEKNFTMPQSRSSVFDGINHSTLIDSSYNASRISVLALLEMIKMLKEKTKRPTVFVFGDMRELGKETEIEHISLIKHIEKTFDYLYCVGPQTKQFIIPKITKKMDDMQWFKSYLQVAVYIKKNLPENSIVLIKGSQNEIYLEEVVKQLLLNKSDISKLCRQSEFWMGLKQKFLNRVRSL
ncbi:MAG: Mur ligase family protein [bacterium]|nr:Mur ligase family protein [bacterium]